MGICINHRPLYTWSLFTSILNWPLCMDHNSSPLLVTKEVLPSTLDESNTGKVSCKLLETNLAAAVLLVEQAVVGLL